MELEFGLPRASELVNHLSLPFGSPGLCRMVIQTVIDKQNIRNIEELTLPQLLPLFPVCGCIL